MKTLQHGASIVDRPKLARFLQITLFLLLVAGYYTIGNRPDPGSTGVRRVTRAVPASAGYLETARSYSASLTVFHERYALPTAAVSTHALGAESTMRLVSTERRATQTPLAAGTQTQDGRSATVRPSSTLRPTFTPVPRGPESSPTVRLDDADNFIFVTIVVGLGWLAGVSLLMISGDALDDYYTRALRFAAARGEGITAAQKLWISRLFTALIIAMVVLWHFTFVVLALIGITAAVNIYRSTELNMLFLGATLVFFYTMVKASPLSLRPSPPPRNQKHPLALSRDQEPEVWKLVDECAALMNVPSFTQIRLQTDARIEWTLTLGSWGDALRGRGDLALEIGLAAFSHLTKDQLEVLICQNYAYGQLESFMVAYHMAYRFGWMLNTIEFRLRQSGSRRFYNPFYLFVLLSLKLYQRITPSMLRFRTIMADRAAAEKVGGTRFASALQHNLYVNTLFLLQAQQHISESQQIGQPLKNLYTLPLDPLIERQARQSAGTWMNQATQRRWGAPSIADRIALLRPLLCPDETVDYGNALYLLAHPGDWQLRLTEIVQTQSAARGNAKPVQQINYGRFDEYSTPKKD